ncbi:MAG: hypothetical protein KF900_12440 [Bacteroidetes bacterium]|nr:hypothetical protein [Bacteroidota bacterium]
MIFLGHLRTWFAVQKFIERNKVNPLENFELDLKKLWIEEEVKSVRWNLILKVRIK